MNEDIKVGDRVRLTLTRDGAELVITGPASKCFTGGLQVGGCFITDDRTVEKLAPAWHDALVIQAGGKTFAKKPLGGHWISLSTGTHYRNDEVAALGEVRVVVDADQQVVDHG